ncbi:capsular biosynthesis protein [Acinetobacter cumulans]|nr:capsular biosynthesis protein [Acinetobacter cumulans]
MYEFSSYIQQLVKQYDIDSIMLFGDCRPIHRLARAALSEFELEWYVFEEGYLRPNHITCEKGGVNGFSSVPKRFQQYLQHHQEDHIIADDVVELGRTFWYAAFWAAIYYIMASLKSKQYPSYQHHRPLTIAEFWPWLKGGIRKYQFKLKERRIEKYLLNFKKKDYFLVPLQTHNDAQIEFHSNYSGIEEFIEEVMYSFAHHAPQDTLLVLKQHPFDRGYREYTQLIQQLALQLNISSRVLYIHDQYLPDLLENARGVVVINSTVGMSAVESLVPVKVCGRAVYDIEPMTMQCHIDRFWQQALAWNVDEKVVQKYLYFLQHTTQFNGSFYKKMSGCQNQTGVVWSKVKVEIYKKNRSTNPLLNVK